MSTAASAREAWPTGRLVVWLEKAAPTPDPACPAAQRPGEERDVSIVASGSAGEAWPGRVLVRLSEAAASRIPGEVDADDRRSTPCPVIQ